jgi:indole-3-glycerol phosphate synthase
MIGLGFLGEMAALARARAALLEDAVGTLRPSRVVTLPARPLQSVALIERNGSGRSKLIAEIKRRSPSAGALREDLEPADLARQYVEAGACAISVVTEPSRFAGSVRDLERVRAAVDVPVLRKDFLVHPLQIGESRDAGASAVLLIVGMLEASVLSDLLHASREMRLDALVEVHGLEELSTALAAGAELVGVNNRDLKTLMTDVRHSLDLARAARERRLPWPRLAVSESGITERSQVQALEAAGYDAVLVGESLLREADPRQAVRRLIGETA